MERTSNDGCEIGFGGDGSVSSVNGEAVDHGMSGTTCTDSQGNTREDAGPSSDSNGDRR